MVKKTNSIKKAKDRDIPLIRSLSQRIWPLTYSAIITPAQIEYMMDLMYSEDALRSQMENSHEFIIAYEGKEPVGFASFSLIEPGVYKLHKIYLLPEKQGKGVGSYMINEIISSIRGIGGNSLLLNVNRNNRARDFYEKLGFEIIREEDIDIGNGYYMNDYVMQIKI